MTNRDSALENERRSERRQPAARHAPGQRARHAAARRRVARRGSLAPCEARARATILDDLATALTVLQRHDRLLQQRFGLAWSDVASIVQDEAARRDASTTSIARLLVAGLRADERGRRP